MILQILSHVKKIKGKVLEVLMNTMLYLHIGVSENSINFFINNIQTDRLLEPLKYVAVRLLLISMKNRLL